MDEIVHALGEQHRELEGLLDGLDDAGWARDSRCEGWSVADVVLHLAQTDALARASADGSFADVVGGLGGAWGGVASVDEGADRMVVAERGAPNRELFERWRSGAAELRRLLAACSPHDRVPWVVGLLSARTLATTRLAECWIHTGDVANALGVELPPTDRLRHIARLAWRTLPYAFGRSGRELAGPVAFELTGPDGQAWSFQPDDAPATVIRGPALDLCLVAARRVDPAATDLHSDGPDAGGVLELVRTYA